MPWEGVRQMPCERPDARREAAAEWCCWLDGPEVYLLRLAIFVYVSIRSQESN
jgi:hypothetical protein